MAVKHSIRGRQLNRDIHQRKALFKGLVNSLIIHEEIQTTAPKAKAIQGLFDKLVTRGKLGTVHARRLLNAFLGDKQAVNKLVDDLGPRMKTRPGGFTRIVKLGRRKGDDAQIVKMEIVDKPAAKTEVKKAEPKVKKAPAKTAKTKATK